MARKIFLYFLLYFLLFTTQVFAVPAFPGAEGFGANAVGGRGGTVYEVINLNDSGPGSLRECVAASGSRVCIFKVGGTILLSSTLTISNPYITIAGQTASGGGILLRFNGGSGDVIHIATHDIIVRYLTIRRGPPSGTSDVNGLSMYVNNGDVVYNIMVDHCSMSWTNDRILFTWYGARDYSIQWSIFSEPLDCNRNSKGCQSAKAVLMGSALAGEGSSTPGGRNASFHHNIIAHSGERNPLIKPAGITESISNVIYNPYWSFGTVDMENKLPSVVIPVNFIGNYFKNGQSSVAYISASNTVVGGAKIYVQGNIGPDRANSSLPETNVLKSTALPYYTSTKNPANPPVPITVTSCNADPAVTNNNSDCETYNQVVAQAKAGNNQALDENGNFFTRRDAVDRRILEEVKRREGKIIDAPGAGTCASGSSCRYPAVSDYTKYGISASEIGTDGWPVISTGTPYTDSDQDGMPDSWENKYGFNPGNVADGLLDADGDGYTNLEEFLNATNPISAPIPTVILCARKGEGDANCDGVINILDFEIWRREFLGIETTTKADFDSSGGVTILDFEIWRRGFLGQ